MSALELQVADRFPAGTKVGVYPRITDFFTPGQTDPVTTATVQKDGTLKLSGLVQHGPYFLAAEIEEERPDAFTPNGRRTVKEWRTVAYTASNPSPALTRDEYVRQHEREAAATAKVAQDTALDAATAPASTHEPQQMPSVAIIEGARDTSHLLPERIEATPKGTQLASHTATGEAVVVGEDPPKQEDIKKGTAQSSDTETGTAAIIEERRRQEDVGRGEKQASATETGEATAVKEQLPKPKTEATTRKTAERQAKSALSSGTKRGKKRATRKAAKKGGKR